MTIVSTLLSYALNRRWAYRARGARCRHHEAMLFFGITAAAVGVNDMPLWAARHLFDLRVPEVSGLAQEISDFASGC